MHGHYLLCQIQSDRSNLDLLGLKPQEWQSRHVVSAENSLRIDIDRLTEAELIDLNNRIVERLRFLNQMKAHSQMLEFRIGDRECFSLKDVDQ